MTSSVKAIKAQIEDLERKADDQEDLRPWIDFDAARYSSPEEAAIELEKFEKQHPGYRIIIICCRTREGYLYGDKLYPFETESVT